MKQRTKIVPDQRRIKMTGQQYEDNIKNTYAAGMRQGSRSVAGAILTYVRGDGTAEERFKMISDFCELTIKIARREDHAAKLRAKRHSADYDESDDLSFDEAVALLQQQKENNKEGENNEG